MHTFYQNIAKPLTHPRVIEKAMYTYYQNSAKLLTHPSIIEKAMLKYEQNIVKLWTPSESNTEFYSGKVHGIN